MGWIAGIGALAGGALSYMGSKDTAKSMQYRPWSTGLQGLGNAYFRNGALSLSPSTQYYTLDNALRQSMDSSLGAYNQGQQNMLGQDFLRNIYGTSQLESGSQLSALQQAAQQGTPYQAQDFGSNAALNQGMLSNFDPNQAAQGYTNLLRQQALPQEQQATQSAMSGLFAKGRLGTTGGANQMQAMAEAQSQADVQRQIAGQQYGLQSQLQAQQGYDQARANQQGLMMNNLLTNQQGALNNFALDQGMFQRNLDLYTNSATATQDRFQRALQLFGGENALNQQNLANFQGLLGSQQSQQQGLMDLGRIGASIGQAQTTANANAAMVRNQGNQDLIAGFLGAANAYAKNKE
jgi:uncharacterized protein YfiM (DUF2279 family)